MLKAVDTSYTWSFLHTSLFAICVLRCISFSFLGMHYAKKSLRSQRSEKVNNFSKTQKEMVIKLKIRAGYPGPQSPLQ